MHYPSPTLRCNQPPPAGTGGSLLVIGSAAGVAFMSIEGAGFGWYARRITPWVAVGYVAALGTYAVLHGLPADGTV
jgi:Na+/H+ antiporter NhaD/arsenite permease-like protein